MYNNQNQIDEIEKRVKDISPDLAIGGKQIYENTVTRVFVTVPVKGNTKVIKKLENIGFKKDWRERTRNRFDEGYASSRERGYHMLQRMCMDLCSQKIDWSDENEE